MCVVSMIGGHYHDKFTYPPPFAPSPQESFPDIVRKLMDNKLMDNQTVTREEFDKLKAEILEMKALLDKARVYDKRMKQPHCEDEGKWALLNKIAEAVGVKLD